MRINNYWARKRNKKELEILGSLAKLCLDKYPEEFHESEALKRVWKAFDLGIKYSKNRNNKGTAITKNVSTIKVVTVITSY